MSYVTVAWSVVASFALLLGLMYGFVWLMDRRARGSLAFAVFAFGLVGVVIVELGMMYASTAAEWGEWVRWIHAPGFLVLVGLTVFVRLHFKAGRPWLMWIFIASRCLILVMALSATTNFNFESIDSISRISFLGEEVSVVGTAVASRWQWLGSLSWVLLLAYLVDACSTLWHRGSPAGRRAAINLGSAVLVSATIAFLYIQLTIWENVKLPALISPPFLILLSAMAFEMSRDQSRARKEIDELRRQLAHAGRVSVLGTLSSSLAHELNQPLGAILLNSEAAELMLRRPDPDLAELREIIGDIQRDDRRAADVIDRLRKLLKRQQLDLLPLSVEGLVQDVAALLGSDAVARQVTLQSECETGIPVIRADKVHLSQVLINLVINGMDAVAELPAAQRRVALRAHLGAEVVELSVEDSGPGIHADLLERIFEPFFTTKPNGMGMGLSVSSTIIKAHGGRIWAENVAGGGTIFRVALPVHKA